MNNDTIHVAIYDTWADWEPGYALAHLASGDWQPDGKKYRIVTVGETSDPITTKGGITLTPDITIGELDPSNSAMLILPGADTWLGGGNAGFVDTASRFLAGGVPVAAICGATVGLAHAGVLNELDHTSNAPQILESDAYTGHARYKNELVVTDGDLITAAGIAPVEFALAIFERLAFYNRAINDNWYLLYGQQDAAGFFGLMDAAGHGG
jgi:putative intracellular protease/amidase